ncbi:Conserved_hypothetical protein [Hexamita inflata]|uniref:FHA domain-containing protein n=1 Tax=Hexamita inflata TaxID=28002 RepID=A0AA86UL83_9EUKA|nr:Conserved hypothetical protein [Hexamita inflata]
MNLILRKVYLDTGQSEQLWSRAVRVNSISVSREPIARVKMSNGALQVYLDDATISTTQCQIKYEPGKDQITVTDQSRNGTFVSQNELQRIIKQNAVTLSSFSNNPVQVTIRTRTASYHLQLTKMFVLESSQYSEDTLDIISEQNTHSNASTSFLAIQNKVLENLRIKNARAMQGIESTQKLSSSEQPMHQETEMENTQEMHHFEEISKHKPNSSDNTTGSNVKEKELSIIKQQLEMQDRQTNEQTPQMNTTKNRVWQNNPQSTLQVDSRYFVFEHIDKSFYNESVEIDFEKTYGLVTIPKTQYDHNFDYQKQIENFDLQYARVWVEGLSDEQMQELHKLKVIVDTEFNPKNIKYFLVAKASRSTRFLMAMISGIPMIDAKTIDSYTKSSSCLLLNPSIYEVTDEIRDKKLMQMIKDTYKKYRLYFISSFLQKQRLLIEQKYLVVGNFTADADITTTAQLTDLINYSYFLNQFGAKVLLLMPKQQDYLFKIEILQQKQFIKGVIRPVVGTTCQERLQSFVNQSQGDILIVKRRDVGFKINDERVDEVDWQQFARAVYIGIGRIVD